MIITVAAIKGGVGKTTLSMVLAETLSRLTPASPVLLLDMDPQGSAAGFADRTDGLLTRVKHLTGRSSGQLSRLIREETAGEELVIIDTPPGFIDIADAAIGEADLVLVPTEPFLDPLTQAIETVEMTSGVAPAVVILNLVNPSANDAAAARSVLAGGDTRLIDVEVPNWVSISRIDGSKWPTDERTLELFKSLTDKVLEEV